MTFEMISYIILMNTVIELKHTPVYCEYPAESSGSGSQDNMQLLLNVAHAAVQSSITQI